MLLTVRRWVAPAAALLSVTIGSSGIGHGDVIPSLTLAPALQIAMLYLAYAVSRTTTPGRAT